MSTSGSEFSLKKGLIEFENPVRALSSTWVPGTIINSITEHKEKLRRWKRTVASSIKKARGGAPWDPCRFYAITLEFRFHPANHGYQSLDVENFLKPVIDAVAAGLFCEKEEDPLKIEHWNYDDSNFRTLLIHRAADPLSAHQEGVHVFVSVRRP